MRVKSKVKIQGRKVHVLIPGAKPSRQGGFNNTNSLRVIYSSSVPSVATSGSWHLGRGGEPGMEERGDKKAHHRVPVITSRQ